MTSKPTAENSGAHNALLHALSSPAANPTEVEMLLQELGDNIVPRLKKAARSKINREAHIDQ
jgi:hypothetical protein